MLSENGKNIKDRIKANNGMLIVGFYNSEDCFCTILRNNIRETLKTFSCGIELVEYDVDVLDSKLKELSIFEIPTYNIYYKDILLWSFESLASKCEIKKMLSELVVN